MKLQLLLFLLLFSAKFLTGQEKDASEHITALAKAQNIEATGKRHNSYYFTFKIIKVLNGTFNDTVIRTKEYYHDFGGGQILSKIIDYHVFNSRKGGGNNTVVIKFLTEEIDNENKKSGNLIWVSEKGRYRSLERLEKIMTKLFESKKIKLPLGLLLRENNGRLFFTIDERQKVAVETHSSNWVIATIDQE
jgi:hypothetical protein